MYSTKKRVHETKLETPKINTVNINEIPREEIRLKVSKPTTDPTLHYRWTQILRFKLDRRVKNNLDTKARNYSREETSNDRTPPKPPTRWQWRGDRDN